MNVKLEDYMENNHNNENQSQKAYIYDIAANGMEVRIPADQYESWKAAQDRIRRGEKNAIGSDTAKRLAELMKQKEEESEQLKKQPEDDTSKDAPNKKTSEYNPWFWTIPIILIVVLFLLFYLQSIISVFIDWWEASDENIWLFLLKIVSVPFAFFGLFIIYRGLGHVIFSDIEKLELSKVWQCALLIIIYIVSVVSTCAVFFELIKY